MRKVIGFIDGFNLYHALMKEDNQGLFPHAKYRWLNYRKLIEQYLETDDELKVVYYFTAVYPDNPGRKQRHNDFIRVQMDLGVKVIRGRFRPVQRLCKLCNRLYPAHEEKRTDVNIAVNMVKLAYEDAFDKAILISADSDLVPALEIIKQARPLVRCIVVLPIGGKGIALSNAASHALEMKEKHLRNCVLPDPYVTKNGTAIARPVDWV